VVGHSYGAPTILLSKKKDYDGIVLWDGSYDEKGFDFEAKYIKGTTWYRLLWGVEMIIGKKMYDEPKKIMWDKLMDDINVPIKFLTSGNGPLVEAGRKYYSQARDPKELYVIKGAGHTFDEDGVEEELFNETVSWFKKFL